MWRSLHDAWWRLATQHHPQRFSDALACAVLSAGSVLYQAGTGLHRGAYRCGWVRPVRFPCPVISIGNLTVGGTGKTACVELIARKLLGKDRRVAVLTRGYGGGHAAYRLLWEQGAVRAKGLNGAQPSRLADEPQLLAAQLQGTPVFVGARRGETGRAACSQGTEVLILDDGFQHWALHRDCDVVLIHARMPLGGWRLFPRGPMREPLAALSRAQVIIVTKADEAQQTVVAAMQERLQAINSAATLVAAIHQPSSLVDGLTGAVCAFSRLSRAPLGLMSSIGDPAGFESTVRRLEAQVAWHARYPDHFRYAVTDWERLGHRAKASRVAAVVTTEKDWVRLRPVAIGEPPVPVLVLGVRMAIVSGEEALDARLARLCAR